MDFSIQSHSMQHPTALARAERNISKANIQDRLCPKL